jgi:hypothetical protein
MNITFKYFHSYPKQQHARHQNQPRSYISALQLHQQTSNRIHYKSDSIENILATFIDNMTRRS